MNTQTTHIGDSDHLGIIVEKITRAKECIQNRVIKRSYKDFDVAAFLTEIYESEINEKILETDDVDEAAIAFETMFKEIIDKYAKIKVFQQRKNYIPYLSCETKALIKEKNVVRNEAIKTNDVNLMKEAKCLSKDITSWG